MLDAAVGCTSCGTVAGTARCATTTGKAVYMCRARCAAARRKLEEEESLYVCTDCGCAVSVAAECVGCGNTTLPLLARKQADDKVAVARTKAAAIADAARSNAWTAQAVAKAMMVRARTAKDAADAAVGSADAAAFQAAAIRAASAAATAQEEYAEATLLAERAERG